MSAEIIDLNGRAFADPKSERSPALFWLRHNPATFLMETATVDAEGAGALILLRGYYWLNRHLPKTDAECAKVCKLSKRKFEHQKLWLFSFFDSDGRSAELDASIEEIERKVQTNRDAGRRGGVSKSLANATANANRPPQRTSSQLELESEIELKKEQKSSSSSPPAPPPLTPRARETGEAIAARALASLPVSARAHPGWRGLAEWIDRLLSDGAEPVDIALGIYQCLRSLKDQPPSTFGYFTAAIERAREARLAPLPEVTRPDPAQHSLGAGGETLRKRLGDEVFVAWFGHASIVSERGDTVTLGVGTRFIRSHIIAEYEAACIAAFSAQNPSIARVEVVVVHGGGGSDV